MNKAKHFFFLLAAILIILPMSAAENGRNDNYVAYVKQYKDLAIKEMNRYKIPASITLAQGLLESGAGKQMLATKANNHFGIKCGSGWTGRSVLKDDDSRNECFRSYKSVEQSYEDHSKFLQKDRYARLYKLKVTDYKGWANGLKACGYATDPNYAQKLISLIERYELYKYDRKAGKKHTLDYTVYKSHDLLYVIATGHDDIEVLSEELGKWKSTIRGYNDFPKGFEPKSGAIIYLQKKHRRAEKPYNTHIVQAGESVHSISQKYGVRMKSLMKRNDLDANSRIQVGDILKLR